jgi:hypothetical protein
MWSFSFYRLNACVSCEFRGFLLREMRWDKKCQFSIPFLLRPQRVRTKVDIAEIDSINNISNMVPHSVNAYVNDKMCVYCDFSIIVIVVLLLNVPLVFYY